MAVPIENDQTDYLNMLKAEGKPHTFKCANCGVYQGEEHKPECLAPKPVVVEIRP